MKKIIGTILILLFLVSRTGAIQLPEVPKERCIEIIGFIDTETHKSIVKELIELDKTDGDIRIYINSEGGVVLQGLAIIDAIKTMRNDVQTVLLGQASSMAVPIFIVGTKGKRVIGEHSTVLFHNVSYEEPTPSFWEIMAPAEEQEWDEEGWLLERKIQKMVQKFQVDLNEIIYEHTKVTHKELAEWNK